MNKRHVRIGGRLVSLHRPLVMGILNITPDSFFDGGKYFQASDVAVRIKAMVEQGADILDIGGISTRPGAPPISVEEEMKAVALGLEAARSLKLEIPISVDTYRAEVAEMALQNGAHIINDVSGGDWDIDLWKVVAKFQVPYVLTHTQGTPQTMQLAPIYEDVVREVTQELHQKLKTLYGLGVMDVLVDPGFGFGKTLTHNYALLHQLPFIRQILDAPLLIGVSRKKMIQEVCKAPATEVLAGSLAAATLAMVGGASILRVHDVQETVQAVSVFQAYCAYPG
jgi:dihydropteroate synthase